MSYATGWSTLVAPTIPAVGPGLPVTPPATHTMSPAIIPAVTQPLPPATTGVPATVMVAQQAATNMVATNGASYFLTPTYYCKKPNGDVGTYSLNIEIKDPTQVQAYKTLMDQLDKQYPNHGQVDILNLSMIPSPGAAPIPLDIADPNVDNARQQLKPIFTHRGTPIHLPKLTANARSDQTGDICDLSFPDRPSLKEASTDAIITDMGDNPATFDQVRVHQANKVDLLITKINNQRAALETAIPDFKTHLDSTPQTDPNYLSIEKLWRENTNELTFLNSLSIDPFTLKFAILYGEETLTNAQFAALQQKLTTAIEKHRLSGFSNRFKKTHALSDDEKNKVVYLVSLLLNRDEHKKHISELDLPDCRDLIEVPLAIGFRTKKTSLLLNHLLFESAPQAVKTLMQNFSF